MAVFTHGTAPTHPSLYGGHAHPFLLLGPRVSVPGPNPVLHLLRAESAPLTNTPVTLCLCNSTLTSSHQFSLLTSNSLEEQSKTNGGATIGAPSSHLRALADPQPSRTPYLLYVNKHDGLL